MPLGSTPVLVDTDIGTDPDDLLALLLIAASPELELQAITTTYGDTHLRARIAAQACKWIGIDPTIAAGTGETISTRETWYAGNEQRQLDEQHVAERRFPDAVDTILDESRRHDGELALIAIGPLTNIAHAVRGDPSLPQRVQSLTVMGGDFTDPNAAEHNLASDSEAARIVFEAGFPLRAIGVDQTRRLPLLRAHTNTWNSGPKTPLRDRVASDLTWWRDFTNSTGILVHDPLAVAMLTHPDLFDLEPGAHTVETTEGRAGRIARSSDNVLDVVCDLQVAALRQLILDRVAQAIDGGLHQGPSR